jgi:hypothetical protein
LGGTSGAEQRKHALDPDTTLIVLNTLGKLRAHDHGMFGTCLDCADPYRKNLPPEIPRIAANFDIDLGSGPN